MDRWAGKVALVTGASVGIGAQITKSLAGNGMKVIAVARRLEKMQELAACIKREFKTDIYPMTCDVRKEEDILKIFKWANDKLDGVDVVINNAGVVKHEPIIDGSTENFRTIIDVNVIAMAICSRELARSVKKRKAFGHIININSLAGHYAESIAIPLSLYSASKYAVTGMSHSLRNEIANEQLNIRITSLSPGAVDTDMLKNLTSDTDLTSNILKKMGIIQVQDIADAVIYVLSAPPNVVISELIINPLGSSIGESMRKD